MELDEKTIGELAGQLGISANRKQAMAKARAYEQKSDDELVSEIRSLQEKLKAADVPYEKQMAAVRGLMPMMNSQQKQRLTRIMALLEK